MQTTTQPFIEADLTATLPHENGGERILPINGMKSHISVRNLNISYGTNRILKNVSIDIPDKKITAIIGPSGCGKTTLLKTFNRLIESADGIKIDGEVLVDGENIYGKKVEVTEMRKKMGLLSQRPMPLPMSIFDNIAYGMRIHGLRKKKILEEKVEYYLSQASLWNEVKDRLHTPATKLSIGQQQRLCIARTIATRPEIILMDEPCSALDPIATLKIEDLMQELALNYTIIIVPHSMQQAARVSDFTAFYMVDEQRAGHLVEFGPTKILFTNPKEKRTEDYITGRFG